MSSTGDLLLERLEDLLVVGALVGALAALVRGWQGGRFMFVGTLVSIPKGAMSGGDGSIGALVIVLRCPCRGAISGRLDTVRPG
jgi:hypothetical protein